MATRRQHWSTFIGETTGFLALAGVAVIRSGNADRWWTFAALVVAYVAGLLVASVVLDRRLPFMPTRRGRGSGAEETRPGSAGLEIGAALVAFAALTIAFDLATLPPSVQWLGVAVVATAAWTMGSGFAAAVRLLPTVDRFDPFRRRSRPT